MQQPNFAPYPISDFIDWQVSEQLILTPKFQRHDVWPPKAKAYLIDTIMRSRPIPPLYIRLKYDSTKKRTIREVVDGQQRLRAIFGYIRGDFPILKVHNEQYGDKYYSDLNDTERELFQSYKLAIHLLENISDAEVHDIFSRINTYTVRTNSQELRNAKYFGEFKQVVYSLANQHYIFWTSNNILSDTAISRMGDAELVSVLIVTMLDGIRQTKDRDLDEFYRRYDDEFKQASTARSQFEQVINIIGDIFDGELKTTEFRRIPLFYSLFCVIYDARFGLPKSERPRMRFTSREIRTLSKKLRELNVLISTRNPTPEVAEFVNATRLSTADVGKRRLRHDFLWDKVLLPINQ